MALDEIGRYIKDMEAITQYKRVMKERDDAINREKEVEDELSKSKKDSNQRIGALTSQNEVLNNTLRCTRDELQTLHNSIKDKEKELETKNQAIDQAHLESKNQLNRIRELESLKVTAEGKTLAEVEKALAEKIEKEVQKKHIAKVQNWRNNEKQVEVELEAVNQLGSIITILGGQRGSFSPALVKSDLPNKVVKAIRRDVDSRQWPIALKSYIDPRVKSLEEKLDQNVFAALKGPWTIRCNLCGSEADYELDTYCIESLLINRAIHVNCANPGCWNHGPILAVGIKLSELLTAHLTKGQLS